MGTRERPHLIIPPVPPEQPRGRSAKERSRNRLTINYVTDGTMYPRCELRPKDERAIWIREQRPFHLPLFLEMFDDCINAPTCEECAIFRKTKL